MTKFLTSAVFASAAVAALAVSAPAFAQAQFTNGPNGLQPNTLADKPHTPKMYRRPLTVRRSAAPAEVAATPVAPAPGPVAGVIGAPVGAASTVVGLPFQVLGGIFPAGGPRPGGVTDVRYVGAGAKQAEIDEGWTVPVPVDRSGPIFVVANGDPTVSPLSFIGYPIRAIGTVAQTPFKILGGL